MADAGRIRKPVAKMASAALRGAVKAVAGVVERRNTVPILSNLWLSARGKALTVHATDLDLWCSAHVDLAEPAQFDTTISARSLAAIMAEAGGGETSIAIDDGKLKLNCGRASYDLPTLPHEEWPMAPERVWQAEFEMPGGELASLFAAVAYAISTEEARYYLNGVYLHVPKGKRKLRAAATDGHRLAMKAIAPPDGAQDIPGIIVPRKTVALVTALADKAVEPVAISACDNRIRFAFDGLTIDSKTIDGTYPDYTRVIPSMNDKVARCDPATLLAATKRATAILTDKTRAVRLNWTKDRLTLEATSPEAGHAREDVPVSFDGGELTIGFNRQYLADILGRAIGDTIEIAMSDAAAASLFTDPKRPDLVQVLMPMRV